MFMEKTNEELAQKGILVTPAKKGKEEFNLKSKIDTPELVFAIKQEIKGIRWRIGLNWLLIGKFLYLVKRDKAWRFDGVDSFAQWIADNREFIGMGLRASYYLVEIWENLVMKLGVTPDQLAEVDRSSAREISRYATKNNVKDLIQLAKNTTHYELVRQLKAMAKGKKIEKVKEVGVCDHKRVVVLYKCLNCGFIFYNPPEKVEVIIDKQGIIDEKKAQKMFPGVKVVRENLDNSYGEVDKEQKARLTKKLK